MNAVQEFIMKQRVLRKVLRHFVKIDTADSLVDTFTSKFDNVAKEQAIEAKEAGQRVLKAQAAQKAATAEQHRNERAAKNLRGLLEAE